MKIVVNRLEQYKALVFRNHKPGDWFIDKSGSKLILVLKSGNVIQFRTFATIDPLRTFATIDPLLMTIATVEGSFAPCEVKLEVT
jgi:hypothetical protein